MNTSIASQVRYLQRPEGRISYTVEGTGPLVVADLRAHGESDTTFREFGDIATGRDLLALIDELGGRAAVLGNSMGAAAAAWAAAERPDAVAGLVLFGPLLRDPAMSRFAVASVHGMYRVLFTGPWGASVWAAYYRSINKGRTAPWLKEHAADLARNMREPGRLRSFRHLTLALTHSVVEPRLPEVKAPMLAFVGALDPDYKDPAAEADWIESLGAQVVRVPESGHYPQAQRPDVIVPATLEFLGELRAAAGGDWGAARA